MELVPVRRVTVASNAAAEPTSILQEVIVGALVALGIILIVLWAVLWLGFHIVAGFIHLLIVIGIILLVWGLIKRGARAVDRHM